MAHANDLPMTRSGQPGRGRRGPRPIGPAVALGAGLTAGLALSACAALAVVGDGSSVSGGQPNRGWLLDGRRLADQGEGFVTHPQWRTRGLRYGTDEMIDLLTTVARRIRSDNAPVRIGIGDLSFGSGGPADPYHRSHQSGRDADLLLFLIDAVGRPYESTEMKPLDDNGLATDGSQHHLDVARTWRLVRALVSAPQRNLQRLFLYEPLTQLVLDYARSSGEPAWLIETARLALVEPEGAPHNDHLHVRIFCSPNDTLVGCRDLGNLTLLDKHLNEQQAALAPYARLWRQLPLVGAVAWTWHPEAPSQASDQAMTLGSESPSSTTSANAGPARDAGPAASTSHHSSTTSANAGPARNTGPAASTSQASPAGSPSATSAAQRLSR
jgi:penicillin-insensitive murein DD-endopeptidase